MAKTLAHETSTWKSPQEESLGWWWVSVHPPLECSWAVIVEKLALLDLITHVRNVFSGLVLAGTLLRMEQPPTVVVVDRRGLRFNFWTALHHQQFQSRNKHEKNKFSKQSLAVSPCPTSSGLDACHHFLEKRPVRTEDVCPWVYLYELCCALDCVKFLLKCFGPCKTRW